MTSKTTRNIQISKIQDVRVDQSVSQRIFNVGDLSIETAGESSRLTVHNVDNPQGLMRFSIAHRRARPRTLESSLPIAGSAVSARR